MKKPSDQETIDAVNLINKISRDLKNGAVVVRQSDGRQLHSVNEVLKALRKGEKVKAFNTMKRTKGGIILP